MKKTLTVNLNGRVFTIDEDAYELLDNYLRNLRIYFRKEEGYTEIITDFEARIEELFSERIRLGYEVITIEQVETIIKQVGKPEDFGNDAENFDSETTKKDENSRSSSKNKKNRKKLYRDIDNKMLGGVLSGIAVYFGWDATFTRLAFVCIIIVLLLAFGWEICWYLFGYLIINIIVPAAKTAQQKLEMHGEEVTIENIGKVVAETSATTTKKSDNKGCIGFGLDFFVSLLKVFSIGVGILIGLPIIFLLIIIFVIVFAVLFGVGGGLLTLPFIGSDIFHVSASHPMLALIAVILIVAIPLFLLIYTIAAHFAKLSPLSKSIKRIGLLVWIVAFVGLIFSGIRINMSVNLNEMAHKNWKRRISSSSNIIDGNGNLVDRTLTIPRFDVIKLDESLIANVRLEQNNADSARILISGESNIIDRIDYSVEDNLLKLYADNNYSLNTTSEIIIKVIAPSIKGVEINSIGGVKAFGKLQSDDFFVKIEGAGHFQADSLYCNRFNSELEGLGNIEVAGKASQARLKLKGAGRIKAIHFEADSIDAGLDGLGIISCNPFQHLNASVEGVGKITYKNEPATKKTWVNGMGVIKKE